MKQSQLFNILDSVDSTNNYAMAKVHEGMAINGLAWFAQTQTVGKGQRGKEWLSEAGKNILLSIVLKPEPIFRACPFYFSAFIALCCHDFLKKLTGEIFFIKWPNDLYWRDRKAGGILIENIFAGSEWKWAVVGIGINVNQLQFSKGAPKAVSILEIAHVMHDPVLLAKKLHEYILEKYHSIPEGNMANILVQYNDLLYKKNEFVKLKKSGAVFSTQIKEVNGGGQLITEDVMERQFNFGEVEWIF
jgi:BirA family biotin operon repressor/biotin-[acetyl-CoA-carboxylase] ligase